MVDLPRNMMEEVEEVVVHVPRNMMEEVVEVVAHLPHNMMEEAVEVVVDLPRNMMEEVVEVVRDQRQLFLEVGNSPFFLLHHHHHHPSVGGGGCETDAQMGTPSSTLILSLLFFFVEFQCNKISTLRTVLKGNCKINMIFFFFFNK